MTCKDGRQHSSQTQTVAGIRKFGLVRATLAAATVLALTLTSHTAIASSSHSFTEYVRVVRVEPIYRNVSVREPQRICRPAVRHHRHRHDHNRHTPHRSNRSHRTRSSINGEVFVAGVIGGAIGRELSRSVNGRPSTGATIAGAVIGSALASSAVQDKHRRVNHQSTNSRHSQRYFAPIDNHRDRHRQHRSTLSHNRHNADHRRDSHHNRNRQHCSTTMQTRTERKQDGFKVTYRYRGHRYQTTTRHHPGDSLAITVTLKPQTH